MLDLIANNLYEHETLTNEEITNLMNYGQLTDPNVEANEEETDMCLIKQIELEVRNIAKELRELTVDKEDCTGDKDVA